MYNRADTIAANIEAFIRAEMISYEKDPRTGPHGPSDELVQELRAKARKAGVLTPHILPDGSHLTQCETAKALIKSGLSPLGRLPATRWRPMRATCICSARSEAPGRRRASWSRWCRATRGRLSS